MSAKINYKAYDGSYYSVVLRDWPKEQAREYLIKTYGFNVSFPIEYIDCTRESEQWKFLEIKKVDSAGEAVPIIKIGDSKTRCPYCWERKCLISSFNKNIHHVGFPEPDQDDAPKYFGYSRFIGQCADSKNQGKYFITEYRESYKTSMDMLVKKQCPLCRAHSSLTVTEIRSPSYAERLSRYKDRIDALKGGQQAPVIAEKDLDASSKDPVLSFSKILSQLSEKDKKSVDNIKGIEYRCNACDAKAMLYFDVARDDKYYRRIEEAYFKK